MSNSHFFANYLLQTWQELTDYLVKHPEKLTMSQQNYWISWFNLCQDFSEKQGAMDYRMPPDKRFQHAEWQNNLMFNFIHRSWKLLSEHMEQLTQNHDTEQRKPLQKFSFYSRQYIDAIAPSNFVNTNPEVLFKTLETNGANLIAGFKQFREDLEQGKGQLQIRLTDFDQFELGKNIACTKGRIIFQNNLMQLVQYTATTEKVFSNPLLIIPPWINKYYILDLQPENSLVKWLVDQGHAVFMISWINPGKEHRETQFSDYLFNGPIAAIRKINEMTKNKKINMVGYCIGGTLLACLLSLLASKKDDITIGSATFLATMLDFSEPGELGTFIDEKQIVMLEEHMQQKGYLDGHILASVFNALRSNDLVWAAFVNNYLKGQQPKAFDLLYWNSDSTNIPALTHSFYLRNMYLNNLLVKPRAIEINHTPLDLGKINIPCYFLATREDHIVPWQSCYQGHLCLKQTNRFVLAGSGHVAGIINPPHKKKYGFWINDARPGNAEQYLSTADFHEGSWWMDWHDWLLPHAGKLMNAKNGAKNKMELGDAPGSYVRLTLADIEKMESQDTEN